MSRFAAISSFMRLLWYEWVHVSYLFLQQGDCLGKLDFGNIHFFICSIPGGSFGANLGYKGIPSRGAFIKVPC